MKTKKVNKILKEMGYEEYDDGFLYYYDIEGVRRGLGEVGAFELVDAIKKALQKGREDAEKSECSVIGCFKECGEHRCLEHQMEDTKRLTKRIRAEKDKEISELKFLLEDKGNYIKDLNAQIKKDFEELIDERIHLHEQHGDIFGISLIIRELKDLKNKIAEKYKNHSQGTDKTESCSEDTRSASGMAQSSLPDTSQNHSPKVDSLSDTEPPSEDSRDRDSSLLIQEGGSSKGCGKLIGEYNNGDPLKCGMKGFREGEYKVVLCPDCKTPEFPFVKKKYKTPETEVCEKRSGK